MLTSLEVANIRGIKHLKINRLGRINLFAGKNGSGKTAVLESLWILMQIVLVVASLIAVTTMACASPAATLESDSASSSQQPEESGPALLLDEESAISILQTYLQECLFGWDDAYVGQKTAARGRGMRAAELRRLYTREPGPTFTPLPPPPDRLPQSEQQKKSWLMDLATGIHRRDGGWPIGSAMRGEGTGLWGVDPDRFAGVRGLTAAEGGC